MPLYPNIPQYNENPYYYSSTNPSSTSPASQIVSLDKRRAQLIFKHLRQSKFISIGLVLVFTCLTLVLCIEVYMRTFLISSPSPLPVSSSGNTNPNTINSDTLPNGSDGKSINISYDNSDEIIYDLNNLEEIRSAGNSDIPRFSESSPRNSDEYGPLIDLIKELESEVRGRRTTTFDSSKVVESSGYSASYLPENVRVNQPNDQASRWSSAANDQNQFLLLKLDRMALLEAVSFGKFHKVHVCNLKEFKVFAGPSLDSLQLIIHSGLNNDILPESFPPNYHLSPSALPLPVLFVKIVPVAAWGSNFNFSIWFVELRGWQDEEPLCSGNLVDEALREFKKSHTHETTRLVLKFLRQNHHTEAFAALQADSQIQLEAPLVTQLHTLLTEKRYGESEELLRGLYQQDPTVFDEFLHEQVPYTAAWTPLTPSSSTPRLVDENGDYRMSNSTTDSHQQPSPRGGHQMIWDPETRKIFLLGGWDGSQDLADMWAFDPTDNSWTLLSADVEAQGGPCGRSCHKAVLHTETHQLYVLGRYLDPERRDPLNLPCDFFRFDLNTNHWTRISSNVRAEGGPGCIYDHQMVVDEDDNCIWVFGGRLLGGTNEQSVYSGLYKYCLKTNVWTLVHSDGNAPINDDSSAPLIPYIQPIRIPARIGHSMLFDPSTRSLLILSGQRYKDQLADFYRFGVDRQTVTHMTKNLNLIGGPEPGYTQRASLDLKSQEMFVFSTLVRSSNSTQSTSSTTGNTPSIANTGSTATTNTGSIATTNSSESPHFWQLDLKTDKWTRIETCSDSPVPSARFAHQIVYDPVERTHFLFGGNPGSANEPSARLNDLWKCKLQKPLDSSAILRHCLFLIRQEIFNQMIHESLDASPESLAKALHYLQKDLSQVVNHSDPKESLHFQSLSLKLFSTVGSNSNSNSETTSTNLFDSLVKFFPKSMQPPVNNL